MSKTKKILMILATVGALFTAASGSGLLPGRWAVVGRILGTVAADVGQLAAPADAGLDR